MRLRIAVPMLLLVSAVPLWAQALVTAYRTPTPVVVDGRLDEACWQTASLCGPFLSAGGGALDARTQAFVCWDADNLYVAYECFDRYLEPALQQMDRVRATVRQHDGNVFADDCVELFLEAAGSGRYQFAANSLGTPWESHNGDRGWDGAWQVAAVRGPDRYVVELRVPFTTLGLKAAADLTLGANFCRERKAVEELSTWSGLQGAFDQNGYWGKLRLAESGPALRQASLAGTVPTRRVLEGEAVGTPDATLALEVSLLAGGKPGPAYRAPFTAAGNRLVARQDVVLPGEVLQGGKLSYSLALRAGDEVLYQTPTLTEALGETQGTLLITGGPGVKWQACQDGQPLTGADFTLHSGLNWLTITAEGARGWLRPEVRVGGQVLPTGAWFVSEREPGQGWQTGSTPGFRAALATGKGIWSPGATRVWLRRGLWVPPPAGRLFPDTNQACLPAGTSQRLKPTMRVPAEADSQGYRLLVEVPAGVRYVSADGTEGARPAEVTALTPADKSGRRLYAARYDRFPGSGMELSLCWARADGGTLAYQPALRTGGTHDWLHLSGTFKAPANAEALRPLLIKWQNRDITGTFWVDNVTICRKGTTTNLLPQGDFEGEVWKGRGQVKAGEGKAGTKGVKIVCRPENVKGQDALWLTQETPVPIVAGAEYDIAMDVKADNLVSPRDRPIASLLFAAEAKLPAGPQTMRVWSEFANGQITEVPTRVNLEILPPLLGVRTREIKIAPCYYGDVFSDPATLDALADNFWRSGMNCNYGGANNELVRRLRQKGPHESLYSLSYEPWSSPGPLSDLFKAHPEAAAVDYPNKPNTHNFCPTWHLQNPDARAMLERFVSGLVQGCNCQEVDWDLEAPVTDPPTFCFCPRCLAAFAAEEKLPADVKLTPESVIRDYRTPWTNFRCRQNAALGALLAGAVRATDPKLRFSMYSGYQTVSTREHYGVDWTLLQPFLDLGIAGYNGDRPAVEATRDALAPKPYWGGELYYLSNTVVSGGAPEPRTWRNRLLRQCLNSGGLGVLIWWLPVMDGGTFYYTSEAAAVLARYEDLILKGRRCESTVQVEGLPAGDWFAYQRGRERWLLALNFKPTPVTVTAILPAGWAGATLVDPVSGKVLGPATGPCEIPPFGVRAVVAGPPARPGKG